MEYERLLAKSERTTVPRHPAQTIRKHTHEVMRTAAALVEVTGESQLSALGLEPDKWIERFKRDLPICALLHDLGKANDHFQGMLQGDPRRDRPQGLRHEAVSFLIARRQEIQEWLRPVVPDTGHIESVLWAVAGHHRKFPPDSAPEGSGVRMRLYLDHPDFGRALRLGQEVLNLPEPPTLSEQSLRLTKLDGIFMELDSIRAKAEHRMASLVKEERLYVACLKACLICADVAGSIGRRGGESMAEWIPKAFARRPTPEQLENLVLARLIAQAEEKEKVKRSTLKRAETSPAVRPENGLKARLRPFQDEIANRSEPVVLVEAGCGSGKTAAAYLWSARQAPNRRLFFCYPTTGTATEGYRDYLRDPSLHAELLHGRDEVDRKLLATEVNDAEVDLKLSESGVEPEMVVRSMGDDEQDLAPEGSSPPRPLAAADDGAGGLEQWSTPIVSCTVDTVLGLIQNNRRGLYAWPSIADSACIFDEIHSYDDALFDALLRFLRDIPGVRCLLMSASLPKSRLQRLSEVVKESRGFDLTSVRGPTDLEDLERYEIRPEITLEDAWDLVRQTHEYGGKILWVVNTVDAAVSLAGDERSKELNPIVYHSRFRYIDRVNRHQCVIKAFKRSGPAFAITTQVCEMSLDLSADLLVTHIAPIPSLIQRLGRLNRFADPEGKCGTRPFLVYEPDTHLPYSKDDHKKAKEWIKSIREIKGGIKQRHLVDPERWKDEPSENIDHDRQFIWLDGGYCTEPWPLREGSPGIEIIQECDRDSVLKGTPAAEVRIPMPPPPRKWDWRSWPEVAFCRIPPKELLIYCPEKGARWKTD